MIQFGNNNTSLTSFASLLRMMADVPNTVLHQTRHDLLQSYPILVIKLLQIRTVQIEYSNYVSRFGHDGNHDLTVAGAVMLVLVFDEGEREEEGREMNGGGRRGGIPITGNMAFEFVHVRDNLSTC